MIISVNWAFYRSSNFDDLIFLRLSNFVFAAKSIQSFHLFHQLRVFLISLYRVVLVSPILKPNDKLQVVVIRARASTDVGVGLVVWGLHWRHGVEVLSFTTLRSIRATTCARIIPLRIVRSYKLGCSKDSWQVSCSLKRPSLLETLRVDVCKLNV